MYRAIAHIDFRSAYCQSRFHSTPKLPKELPVDYERRTWKNRLHVEDGKIFIPGMAFANCVKEAAQFLSIQVPGKGKATYTKHFAAGLMVIEDIDTGRSPDDAIEQQLFVPSDGRRGGGSRVMRSYPILMPPLSLSVPFEVSDDTITPEVLATHLHQAGSLIGVGSFRVRNNGTYGRFVVKSLDIEPTFTSSQIPPINYVGVAA